MEKCIVCGKETDSVFTLYEAHIGNTETVDERTEYIALGARKIRRVHRKIITNYDAVTEHPFGYCPRCLGENRRRGIKYLIGGCVGLMAPAAVLFMYGRGLGGGSALKEPLSVLAPLAGFAGLIIAFMGVHYVFSGKKSLPYDRKKGDFDGQYAESRSCKIMSPGEYEYYRKNGMKDVSRKAVDLPA